MENEIDPMTGYNGYNGGGFYQGNKLLESWSCPRMGYTQEFGILHMFIYVHRETEDTARDWGYCRYPFLVGKLVLLVLCGWA